MGSVFLLSPDLQWGCPRAFKVGTGSVEVQAIQERPQRRVRDENSPPAAAHVRQRDQLAPPAVVRDEGKDFWRDPVDGRENVLDGLGDNEQLRRVLHKYVDPNRKPCQFSRRTPCLMCSLYLVLGQGRRDPARFGFE